MSPTRVRQRVRIAVASSCAVLGRRLRAGGRWLLRKTGRLLRRRPSVAGALAGSILVVVVLGLDSARASHDRQAVLDAIRHVESGGRAAPPDGDGGKAIGPYQIHRAYWQDAVDFDPALGGRYQDCRDRAYAERVIEAYMQRWAPGAWRHADAEVLARVHNGGPSGARTAATLPYWERVRLVLGD